VTRGTSAWIGLGSNLGDRAAHLGRGLGDIERTGRCIRAASSVWETEPVGVAPQPWFLNMVVEVSMHGSALALLDLLLDIELRAGRTRGTAPAPRTLDLDLLAIDDLVLDHPRLSIPHPRMWSRRFVLEPLCEIAPGMRNPGTGRTALEELARLGPGPAVRRVGRLAPGGALLL
jgi:2-amino-4-hydroxy-6-hydroxymethyldihydropteridine diphosphokinase